MNLNYKPENKDKDSSEILLEYIKNDYWYKQGHKSKNYILSNEIISEYFKKKDYTHPSCFYWQYKFIKMSRNYFINVSIVSLCSIYQTIALIRDFNIDLQWGRYYVSLLLFFFIKKRILEWRRCHFLLNANLM